VPGDQVRRHPVPDCADSVITHMSDCVRCLIYTRISKDKLGDGHGVENQLADLEKRAVARGWTVVYQLSDNDIGVTRKDPTAAGKYRPGYEEAMRLVDARAVDVVREWTKAGVRPVQSKTGAWTRQSVRTILMNPRIAGLSVYKGEIVGAGDWEPLVSEETWRAVHAILEDPSRKPPRGVRTLLGGLALCPCGNVVVGMPSHTGHHIYRCSPASRNRDWADGHVARQAAPVEDFITEVVIGRLSRPDAADLVAVSEGGPDVGALREEAAAIRQNLEEMAADRALGLITRPQMLTATERGNTRLAEIAADLEAAARENVLAPLAAAENAAALWEDLDLSRKRAVITTLMTITLLSPGMGARVGFDPATVQVTWRQQV
jgi:site-specific DNA recombinase